MKSKSSLISLTAIALSALTPTALAFDWQSELSIKNKEGLDDPTYHTAFTYFFNPLSHGTTSPWSELAFTDRTAILDIDFGYSSQSRKIPTSPPPFSSSLEGLEIRSESKVLNLNYTHRKASSKHSVSGLLSLAEQEFAFPRVDRVQPRFRPLLPGSGTVLLPITDDPQTRVSYVTEETRAYRYGIGYHYYLADAWTVGADFSLAEFEIADIYELALGTNRLWDLGLQQWAGFRAKIAFQERNTTLASKTAWFVELQGRFYFSERTGLALLLNIPEGGDRFAADLQLEHYFTQQAYGRIGYTHVEYDIPSGVVGADSSTSEYSLSLGLRF